MLPTLEKRRSRLSIVAVSVLTLSLAVACGDSDDDGSSDGGGTAGPSVSSTVPLSDATEVAIGGNISVTFSEAMDPSTITAATVTVTQGANEIAGTVTYSGVTAIFDPTNALDLSTAYTATVTASATNLVGDALAAAHVWSFTTAATGDATAPTVVFTVPADTATNVTLNGVIRVDFSEPMNPTTLTTATFTIVGPGPTSVAGTVTYSGTRARFVPLSDLALDTLYEASVSTGATDLAGNALESDFEWSFTTSATAPLGPDPVLLGLAEAFVILSKSGIDTVPSSAVTGDIGVSPIDSTAITGFSPLTLDATNEFAISGQVTGKVFAASYASPTPANLTTAISDMETAYTDAAGRITPDFVELGDGEIGGMTLVPGLYKCGPDDVWIFQISGDVTQANGASVLLSGGASPQNIFWQTFGQLMIGTTAHFEGIALCQTAIVLGTGASVNGRLLAQTAVTLKQNAVTQPTLTFP